MKKYIFLLLLFPIMAFSQTYNSWEDEQGLSSNSKIKTLNIFINIIYDVHPNTNAFESAYWPRVTNTLLEGINVAGTIPSYLSSLISADYSTNSTNGTITRLYGESSFDSLQLTGDFIVVNIRESRVLNDYESFTYYNIINTAITMVNENGFSTVFGHNNINDYIIQNNSIFFTNFCIRNITSDYGELNIGSGYGSLFDVTNRSIEINGITYYLSKGTIQSIGGSNYALNPSSVLVHEISHSLFGDNNFHASGGNHRHENQSAMSFPNIQGGYGLMGAAGSSLVGCNGYERWRMHWKHPNAPCYISARNPQNTSSISSDISREDGNKSFYLRDFVTYGDEIRIRLPYKDNEQASNQYIWLENHQVGHNGKLDFLQYSNEYDCRPQGMPGIYAYYQVGRDVLSGPRSTVWFAAERDNLKIIPAEGYWDYVKASDNYNMGCVSYEDKSYSFHRNTENPFCGAQDQEYQIFPPADATQLHTSYEYPMWRKYIGNTPIDSLPSIGDNRDAFSSYRKINMSTNPSTCNAKTFYAKNGSNPGVITSCDTIRNTQTTYLTGLSIEMIPQQNHDFLVNIRWDDYDITNDARWTGKVVLKDTAILNSGHTITLAQNRTVAQTTRDPQTGLFAKRSQFVCEAGSYFRQEQNSVVQLTENSCMHLDNGCTYIIGNNSELRVGNGCTLTVNQTADLQLQGYARIVVDSGGVVNVYDSVKLGNEAYIVIRPGGKLVVDGGTLTAATPTGMWAGIMVEGNRNARQLTYLQGMLVLKNGAVIEHAHNAVTTADYQLNGNTTGGIINAENCSFKNNKRAIQFLAYENRNVANMVIDNVSSFEKCTFTVDNDNHFAANGCTFNTHASLWDVRGVSFSGCTFSNSMNTANSDYRTAITSLDAGFKVQEFCSGNVVSLCDCSESDKLRSSFTKFSTAADISTSGSSKGTVIRGSNFSNNYEAVYVTAQNNVEIFQNNINLSSQLGSYTSNYGIRLNSASGYLVEENNFTKTHTNTPTSCGIAVSGSGSAANSLYRNSFSKLTYGITIGGTNGSSSNGLQCSCNSFSNGKNDIYMYLNSTMAPSQGSSSKGADNTFTGTTTSSLHTMFSSQALQYFRNTANSSKTPINPQLRTNQQIKSGNMNYCLSTLCNNFIIIYTGEYITLLQQRDSLNRLFEERQYAVILDKGSEGIFLPEEIAAARDCQQKLVDINMKMSEISSKAVHQILGDSVLDYEKLEMWYDLIPEATAKYDLAEVLFEQGKFDRAEDVLSELKSVLADNELDEFDHYQEFYGLKKSLATKSGNDNLRTFVDWPSASGAQIAELQKIAESSKGRTSSMARSVLCFFFDICYDDDGLEEAEMLNPGLKALETEDASDNTGITIWPNPTSGKVSVLVSGENTIRRIELYDVFGHMLVSRDTEGFSCELDLSGYTTGSYILTITLSDGTREVRKVVKK